MARRINNRKSNPFFKILAIIFGFSFVVDIFEGIFFVPSFLIAPLIALAVMFLISIAMVVGIIKLIIKAVNKLTSKKNKNSTNTTNTTKTTQTVNTRQLLNSLNYYFENHERLELDEETFLIKTEHDENRLESYDIYMNDEYISNLLVLSNAYPSGLNSLANKARKIINTSKAKKKAEEKTQQEIVKVEPVKQPTVEKDNKENKKDCSYFLSEFQRLNDHIPNEQITNDLNNTSKYLEDIKKIENEFPESKEKTIKLYQYYLPMLVDILQNYHRLAENASNHEEFKENEDRLSKTIVLINGALKTISRSLVEEYYTDLKVDMKTLESILKKDGLIDEFSKVAQED